jgi:hypothetical protein
MGTLPEPAREVSGLVLQRASEPGGIFASLIRRPHGLQSGHGIRGARTPR